MNSLRRLPITVNQTCKSYLRRCLTSSPNEATEAETPKEKNILVDHSASITLIGINRPEKKNCLDLATAEELSQALESFDKDEKSKVGVLYGVGGNFCAGYDLSEIAKYDGKNESTLPQFGTLAHKAELCKKPLIAALSGYAVGIGFELALMCDMRVVEDTAVLGFLNRRFDIPILSGGTVRLPALIGYSRAIEIILTGRPVTAEEAFNYGLAIRYTACGTVIGQSVSLANCLSKFSQKVLLADRASTQFAAFGTKQLEEALQFEKDNASHLLLEEGVEGAKKFVHEGIGRHGKSYNIKPMKYDFRELDKDLL